MVWRRGVQSGQEHHAGMRDTISRRSPVKEERRGDRFGCTLAKRLTFRRESDKNRHKCSEECQKPIYSVHFMQQIVQKAWQCTNEGQGT